ncbi:MAG: F0F1 ATP synthase subunit delta [Rhodothermales bacterium]|nr:F0F1 ATP synthase subunit delta [Rhodothermales bacterium]
MSDLLVAKRYASALFDLASQEGRLGQTDEDMEMIAATMSGSPELVRVFESPIVSRARKEAITRELFSSRIGPATSDFLSMLISKRRENIFPAIIEAYRGLRDEQQGIVEASARSATTLSAEEEDKLRSSLEQVTGKQVRLKMEIDESLIGGVTVKVGDTVYDGSVKHKLEDLRTTFRMHSTASSN